MPSSRLTCALRAIEHKSLAAEINPLEVDGVTVSDDEQPGKAKIDRIPTLQPGVQNRRDNYRRKCLIYL